jgi:cellulose synthase/poly-beta-1,6-N-acetylglucosamine synthase-like glycosyltransferase
MSTPDVSTLAAAVRRPESLSLSSQPTVGAPVRVGEVYPQLSIVAAVHNEGAVVVHKLPNLVELNYPSDGYEIAVVPDSSTDAANDILRAGANERLHVAIVAERELAFPVLNTAAALALVYFISGKKAVWVR